MRARAGFTLIELLVVLAIVALLLTLAVPRYFGKVDSARETILAENLRTTRQVIDQYFEDNGRYPQSLQELVEKKYLPALPYDPIAESDSAWITVAPEGASSEAVYSIHSSAEGEGRNGKPYREW